MAFRRQNCRKKEYLYDQKPFFNAIPSSRGAFTSPGIIQSIKNWYSGGRSPPPMPSIVTEPDDIDCRCPARGSRLLQLQSWLLCSPLPRAALALLAARGVLYLLGIRVCFVKMV
ncbi:uncharacterized protein LOC122378463 [Amphibalanus amphitrite]|uniref:uncharacterized protein LOC122378463 n=1 Tax=Amphibalanus amphitrite TaxID=1232801 RepID=UPI001C9210AB|nr:uncharacterized protein LOC122378463 [Amphibalanus amphitrite]XP_043215493.1 uncharacterized protein LOC122378463 [Amphibalanus amphitrite]